MMNDLQRIHEQVRTVRKVIGALCWLATVAWFYLMCVLGKLTIGSEALLPIANSDAGYVIWLVVTAGITFALVNTGFYIREDRYERRND
jgi:hypothetical protein